MNAVAVYMSRALIPLTRLVGIYTAAPATAMGRSGPPFQAIPVLCVDWLVLYWRKRPIRKLIGAALQVLAIEEGCCQSGGQCNPEDQHCEKQHHSVAGPAQATHQLGSGGPEHLLP